MAEELFTRCIIGEVEGRRWSVVCLVFDIHFKIAHAAGEDHHSCVSLQAQAERPGASLACFESAAWGN